MSTSCGMGYNVLVVELQQLGVKVLYGTWCALLTNKKGVTLCHFSAKERSS